MPEIPKIIKKILLVNGEFPPMAGGGGIYTFNLAYGLASTYPNLDIVVLAGTSDIADPKIAEKMFTYFYKKLIARKIKKPLSSVLVPRGGLEPPCLTALPPQGSKSTNFSTWALRLFSTLTLPLSRLSALFGPEQLLLQPRKRIPLRVPLPDRR